MATGRLDPLQERVLGVLAGASRGWRLTGGAALAGFHLSHRATRDLDLLWAGLERLGDVPGEVRAALAEAGLSVETLQTAPSFHRLRVADGGRVTVVDLVAEPVAPVEQPEPRACGDAELLVDTEHEILVNKLCALLGRAEPRDLVDVGALLAAGGSLERAVADAPRKDGGFSPLTLAWVLQGLELAVVGAAAGLDGEEVAALERTRGELVDRLLRLARPG